VDTVSSTEGAPDQSSLDMSQPRHLSAVIFDCDGTLVDTEPLAWAAWARVLAPSHVQITESDRRRCTGRSFRATYDHFAARAELPVAGAVEAELRRTMLATIVANARPFPDAVEACRRLHEMAVPMAVASSSARARLDLTLRTTGLYGYFGVTVAGDEVHRGKPDPQLLLTAAAGLGVSPTRCLVVEDAAAGVEAARAAGMDCLVVRREHNVSNVSDMGADHVCDTLAGLDRLLDHIARRVPVVEMPQRPASAVTSRPTRALGAPSVVAVEPPADGADGRSAGGS
jgi:HAD superfamily hydrolase (TIGR01509 family)